MSTNNTTATANENSSPNDMITAVELAAIKRDREELRSLQVQAQALAQSLREREADIIARIEADADIDIDGEAAIIVKRRQNISWLTVCRAYLGEAGIIAAKDAWPVSFYKELQLP